MRGAAEAREYGVGATLQCVSSQPSGQDSLPPGCVTDGMLEQVRGPADLQHLSQAQLDDLAIEIREFLIHKVAATGGHLGRTWASSS